MNYCSSEYPQICMMGKYHNVLYVALKVAWDYGVQDSPTICQLLGKEGDQQAYSHAQLLHMCLLYG